MSRLTSSHWHVFRAVLAYLLRGRLRFPDGHLPPAGHTVPAGFTGVGVATAENPAVDAYVIDRLDELGIDRVRLDLSYGGIEGPAGRLLEKLLSRGFFVVLHLVQPFDAARAMLSVHEQERWRHFLTATFERFGSRIEAVEIGSTVNRKRWAGYSIDGFMTMWEIACREIRSRKIVLAGPSVTDFEPLFNIGLLSLLRRKGLLPDIHTNNLFSERCIEPERFDHRVFGKLLSPLFRLNMVRKARLLQRIGGDFGVPRLWSPAAFWTLPRIGRMLPATEEKQADYLARYLVLCAASGALERAWWGPLLCCREGLIDDGATQYPSLERITHYADTADSIEKFRVRPAFHALRTFNKLIVGSRYEGRGGSCGSLEIHVFRNDQELIHAVWTSNGKAAALSDIYSAADLSSARFIGRDGDLLKEMPTLAGEAPIYLCWPAGRPIGMAVGANTLKDFAIDWHAQGRTHVLFRENGWNGILRARDADEATRLLEAIHPERIGLPARESTLRHARNAIWIIDDPHANGAKLVVKQPVKMYPHKRYLDRFKPSKGLRSWNGTCELLRRGIDAAAPVAYFEHCDDKTLTQNYYVCEYVPADFTVRELMSAFAGGAISYRGIDADDAYRQLVNFLLTMHGRGIFFRDLSGGNILIRCEEMGTLAFSLIDTGRIHVFARPLSLGKRMADLVRICNKLHWPGRERLLAMYFSAIGHRLMWYHRLVFVRYDFKVVAKRRFGRKALKRLFWN